MIVRLTHAAVVPPVLTATSTTHVCVLLVPMAAIVNVSSNQTLQIETNFEGFHNYKYLNAKFGINILGEILFKTP